MPTLQELKLPQLRALAETLDITKDNVAGDARKPQSWIDAITFHVQKEAFTAEEFKEEIKGWIFNRYELETLRQHWGDYCFRDELYCTIKNHVRQFPRYIESRFDDGWQLFLGWLEAKFAFTSGTLFNLDNYITPPKPKNTWADAADVEDDGDDELLPLRSPSRAVPVPAPEPEVPSLPTPEPEVPAPQTDDDDTWELDTFLPVDVAASRFSVGDKVCVFHGTAAYRAGQIIDFKTCNRTPNMPLVRCDDGIERFLPPQMMQLIPEGQMTLFPLDEFDIAIAQMEAEFEQGDDRDRDIKIKIPPGYPEPGTVEEEEYWWIDHPDDIEEDGDEEELLECDRAGEVLPMTDDRVSVAICDRAGGSEVIQSQPEPSPSQLKTIAICDRNEETNPDSAQFWLITYQGWVDSFDTNVAVCNEFMDEFSYLVDCDRAGDGEVIPSKPEASPNHDSMICDRYLKIASTLRLLDRMANRDRIPNPLVTSSASRPPP